jgi:hypothetical protein
MVAIVLLAMEVPLLQVQAVVVEARIERVVVIELGDRAFEAKLSLRTLGFPH